MPKSIRNSLAAAAALALGIEAALLANEPKKDRADPPPVSIEVARDRAQLLHNVYSATLHVMHERYFHDERAIVPARALEDVFEEMSQQSHVKARWISINTKPMSIHHEPKTEFEKHAAKAIGDSGESQEQIKDGYYYRAAPIPLGGGCISCHTGFFAGAPKSPRYAALVLKIKVEEK
jgi:hypothetical protein